jgi:uncharacterized protein
MAPTPDEVLRPGIAASAMMARYGQALDRDSAHEILARKLEAGAEAAERERLEREAAAHAEAAAKERARVQAAAEREARAARSRSRSPQSREKSVVEQITDSSAFKQFARTAGAEIVRSIFGTARRSRRRR